MVNKNKERDINHTGKNRRHEKIDRELDIRLKGPLFCVVLLCFKFYLKERPNSVCCLDGGARPWWHSRITS